MSLSSKEIDLARLETSEGISPNIMVFDVDVRGHHAGYIQHLITYWRDCALPGSLNIVVVPEFFRQHSSVVEIARNARDSQINFIPISEEEAGNLKTVASSAERFWRSFQEWKLIKKYAKKLAADRCLLMFFDSLLTRMSLGIKPPCPMSGIFFRPVSHYRSFTNYQPTPSERFWELREKYGLARILAGGYFANFFSLDPIAANYFSKQNTESNVVYLPDPVRIYETDKEEVAELKRELSIEPERQVALLFGALAQRKGIYELLEAIRLLPPTACEKLCLLLVGPVDDADKEQLKTMVADVAAAKPIQIVTRHQFIIDTEIQPYFELSDLVLAPYQRHVGMSAILVRAAATKKPVLSSDYGIMGEMTRLYQLGMTVDSAVAEEIASGLTSFLDRPAQEFCNLEKMAQFAEENKAERFARVIFENILATTNP